MPDPTPIPDVEVDGWPGARRLTIGAPPGLEDQVRPIEAIVDQGSLGKRYSTRWVFTDEEITRLAAGDPVYVSFYGVQLVPHLLSFLEPAEGVKVEDSTPVVPPELLAEECPDCGGKSYHVREDCPRVGTCGQFGPPWYPNETWHPIADWAGDDPAPYMTDQSTETPFLILLARHQKEAHGG